MTTHDTSALDDIGAQIERLRDDVRRLPPIGNVPLSRRPAAAAKAVALYDQLTALSATADQLARRPQESGTQPTDAL